MSESGKINEINIEIGNGVGAKRHWIFSEEEAREMYRILHDLFGQPVQWYFPPYTPYVYNGEKPIITCDDSSTASKYTYTHDAARVPSPDGDWKTTI